jgi:hypothetical protein
LQTPLKENWNEVLGSLVHVDLDVDAKELNNPAVQERHRIYCYLLMKLVVRFWNGDKNGPFGIYPLRDRLQLAGPKGADDTPRLSTATVPIGTAISDITLPASRSTVTVTSSISISTTTPSSGARPSTPSRGWLAGCSA